MFGHFLRTRSFHLCLLPGTFGHSAVFFRFLLHPFAVGTSLIQLALKLLLGFASLNQSFFQFHSMILRDGCRGGDEHERGEKQE